MDVERETLGEETVNGWRDRDGFIGPFRPGTGPRSDPRGDFPTGPSLGSRMPDVSCIDADGKPFDLHEDRGDRPAIFVFFRSAVW
ncbi:MAG: hypothetical protein PVF57_06495 [Pseudomonadales bacterium]|jgi:hypothetical protein